MAKKRILIQTRSMTIGGIAKALLGLLYNIDYEKYQVDLFMNNHSGVLTSSIPKGVNLLPEIPQYALYSGGSTMALLKRGYFGIAIGRKWAWIRKWLFSFRVKKGDSNNSFMSYQIEAVIPHLPNINPDVEYDLAVCFFAPVNVISSKVRAKRRVGWIHSDYHNYQIPSGECRSWLDMDYIVSISDMVTDGFCLRVPGAREKIVRIDHMIPAEHIHYQALLEDISGQMGGDIKLVTMARMVEDKNILNAVKICKELVGKSSNLRWYVIGPLDNGSYYDSVKETIERLDLERNFILMGPKSNPYPYVAAADIYIQPSLSEAKSVAVIEAQILRKVVIIANYNTAKSQLRDGVDGVIVDMSDINRAADGIWAVIEDRALRESLVENCAATKYNNSQEIDKFYALIP